jgi:hypothetical protein
MRPKFSHDCDRCKYLGTLVDIDLYICFPNDTDKSKRQYASYVGRYGNGGSQYYSGYLRHPEDFRPSGSSPDHETIVDTMETVASLSFAIASHLVRGPRQ